jgi:hypothetical protein
LRKIKTYIDERMFLSRDVTHEDSHLAVLDFTQSAAPLPGNTHRVLPLFDKAGLIEHQDTLRIAQFVGHELMVIEGCAQRRSGLT